MPQTEGTSALKPEPAIRPSQVEGYGPEKEEQIRNVIANFEQDPAQFPTILKTKREYIKSLKRLQPGDPLIISGLNELDAHIFVITEIAQLSSRGLSVYIQQVPGNPNQIKIALNRGPLDLTQYPGYSEYQLINPQQKIIELEDRDFAAGMANHVEANPPGKAKWGLARSIGKSAAQLGVGLIPTVGGPAAFIMSMRGKLEKYGHYEGRVQLRDEDFKWETFVQERNDPQTGKLALYSINIDDRSLESDPRLYWLRQLALYKEGFSFDARILNSLGKLTQGNFDKKAFMEQIMFILGDRATLAELQKAAAQLNIEFPTIDQVLSTPPNPPSLNLGGLQLLIGGLKQLSVSQVSIVQFVGGVGFVDQLNSLNTASTLVDETLDINASGWINKLMRGKRINTLTSIEAAIAGARSNLMFSTNPVILAVDAGLGLTQTVINTNRRIKNRVAEAEIRSARPLTSEEKAAVLNEELLSSATAIALGAMSYGVASYISGLSLGNAVSQGIDGITKSAAGSGVKALVRGITGVSFGLFMGMRGREKGETVNFEYGLKKMMDFFAGQSVAGAFDRLVAGLEGNTEVVMHQIAHHLAAQQKSVVMKAPELEQMVSDVQTTPLSSPVEVTPDPNFEQVLPVKEGNWPQAGDVFVVVVDNTAGPDQVFDNLMEYAKVENANLRLNQTISFYYQGANYSIEGGVNVGAWLSTNFVGKTPEELSEIFSMAINQQPASVQIITGPNGSPAYGIIKDVPFISADRYVLTATNSIENPAAAANVSSTADFERQQQQQAHTTNVVDVQQIPEVQAQEAETSETKITGPAQQYNIEFLGSQRTRTLVPIENDALPTNYGQLFEDDRSTNPNAGKLEYFEQDKTAYFVYADTDGAGDGGPHPIGFRVVDANGNITFRSTLNYTIEFTEDGRIKEVKALDADGLLQTVWFNATAQSPSPEDTTAANTSTTSGDNINVNVRGTNRKLEEVPGYPGVYRDENERLREFDAGGGTAHTVYVYAASEGYRPEGIQYGDGQIYLFDENGTQVVSANEVIEYVQVGNRFLKVQFVNGRVNVVTEVDGMPIQIGGATQYPNEVRQLWDNPEVHATRSAGERNLFGVNRPAEYVGDGYYASANKEGRTLTLAGGAVGFILYNSDGNVVGIRTDDGIDHVSAFTPGSNPDGSLILFVNGRQHTVKFKGGYVDYIEVATPQGNVFVYDNREIGDAKPIVSVSGLESAPIEPQADLLQPQTPDEPQVPSQPTITSQDGFNIDETQYIDVGNGRQAVMVSVDDSIENYTVGDPNIYIIPGLDGSTVMPNDSGFTRLELGFSNPIGNKPDIGGVIFVRQDGSKVFVDLDLGVPAENATFNNGVNRMVTVDGRTMYLQFVEVNGVTRLAGITETPIYSAADLATVNKIMQVGNGANWSIFETQVRTNNIIAINPEPPVEEVPQPAISEVAEPSPQAPAETQPSTRDGIQVDTSITQTIETRGEGVKVTDPKLVAEARQDIYIVPATDTSNAGTLELESIGPAEFAFSADGKKLVGMIVTSPDGLHFIDIDDLELTDRENTIVGGNMSVNGEDLYYYFANDDQGITRLAYVTRSPIATREDLDTLTPGSVLYGTSSNSTWSNFYNLLPAEQGAAEPTEMPAPVPTTTPVVAQTVIVNEPSDIKAGVTNIVSIDTVRQNEQAYLEQIGNVINQENTEVKIAIGNKTYTTALDTNYGIVLKSEVDIAGSDVLFTLSGVAIVDGKAIGTYYHTNDNSIEFVLTEDRQVWVKGQYQPIAIEDFVVGESVSFNGKTYSITDVHDITEIQPGQGVSAAGATSSTTEIEIPVITGTIHDFISAKLNIIQTLKNNPNNVYTFQGYTLGLTDPQSIYTDIFFMVNGQKYVEVSMLYEGKLILVAPDHSVWLLSNEQPHALIDSNAAFYSQTGVISGVGNRILRTKTGEVYDGVGTLIGYDVNYTGTRKSSAKLNIEFNDQDHTYRIVDDNSTRETNETENTPLLTATEEQVPIVQAVTTGVATETPTVTVELTPTLSPTPVPGEGPTAEATGMVEPPTVVPSPTPSPSPTYTVTPTQTFIPTDASTPTVTASPTSTPIPTGTNTPSPTPTDSPTSTPTATDTPSPSPTPSATPSPTLTPTPLPTETPISTETPTTTPTVTESPTPTLTPTPIPTLEPPPFTSTPTQTLTPTETPTPFPTATSTVVTEIENISSPLFISNPSDLPTLNIDAQKGEFRQQIATMLVGSGLFSDINDAYSHIDNIKVYGSNEQDVIDSILSSRGGSYGTTPITYNAATGEYEVAGIAFGSQSQAIYNSGLLMVEEIIQAAVYDRLLDAYNLDKEAFARLGIETPQELIESFNTGQLRALGEIWQWAIMQNQRSDISPVYSFTVLDTAYAPNGTSGRDSLIYLGGLINDVIPESLKSQIEWTTGNNMTNIMTVLNNPADFVRLNSYLFDNYGYTLWNMVGMSKQGGGLNIPVADGVVDGYKSSVNNLIGLHSQSELNGSVSLERVTMINNSVINVLKLLNGQPYVFFGINNCSGYIARILEGLGLTIDLANATTRYRYKPGDGFPAASTVAQVNWWQGVDTNNQFTQLIEISDFISRYGRGDFTNLRLGQILYFQTAENPNGYNAYSHVVMYLGNGEFTDFASGMETGPRRGRSLDSILNGIYGSNKDIEAFDRDPFDGVDDKLQVFIVDTSVALDTLGVVPQQNLTEQV